MKTKITKKKKAVASPTFRLVAQLADGRNINSPVTGSPAIVKDATPLAVVVTDEQGQSNATGDESVAISGLGGTANVGSGLAYVLGFLPTNTVPVGGLATAGARGVAIVGQGGTAKAGDGGIAAALENGNALVQACGVAIAINMTKGRFDATVQVDFDDGALVLGYINKNGKLAFSVATTGKNGIKKGKPYKVDKNGKITLLKISKNPTPPNSDEI